jgi:hypothetical protein
VPGVSLPTSKGRIKHDIGVVIIRDIQEKAHKEYAFAKEKYHENQVNRISVICSIPYSYIRQKTYQYKRESHRRHGNYDFRDKTVSRYPVEPHPKAVPSLLRVEAIAVRVKGGVQFLELVFLLIFLHCVHTTIFALK